MKSPTAPEPRRTPLAVMRIGELAARAGVTPDAVRYYERAGVLPKPVRSPSSGYRLYGPDSLTRLTLVRQARGFGLSLREIRALMQGPGGRHSEGHCRQVRQLLADKVAWFDARILELQQFRETLAALRCSCDRSLAERNGRDCPVFTERFDERFTERFDQRVAPASDSPAPPSSR